MAIALGQDVLMVCSTMDRQPDGGFQWNWMLLRCKELRRTWSDRRRRSVTLGSGSTRRGGVRPDRRRRELSQSGGSHQSSAEWDLRSSVRVGELHTGPGGCGGQGGEYDRGVGSGDGCAGHLDRRDARVSTGIDKILDSGKQGLGFFTTFVPRYRS